MRILLLIAVSTFLFGNTAIAEVLERNNRGEVRIVADEWKPLNKDEVLAYENPGKEVETNFGRAFAKRVDFFHHVPVMKHDIIVFKDGKIKTVRRGVEKYGEKAAAISAENATRSKVCDRNLPLNVNIPAVICIPSSVNMIAPCNGKKLL